MEIRIKDIAKIHSADIKLDGITVIAGKNNTGKSTIGKLLSAFFITMYDRDKKNMDARVHDMHNFLRWSFRRAYRIRFSGGSLEKVLEDCFTENKSFDFFLRNMPEELTSDLNEDDKNNLQLQFNKILGISDEKLIRTDIEENFLNVFGRKINSQITSDIGSAEYIIKNESNIISFKGNKLDAFTHCTHISNTATYISNPSDIVDLHLGKHLLQEDLYNKFNRFKIGIENREKGTDIVSKILNADLLKSINDQIKKVLPGQFVETDYGLGYSNNGIELIIESISTGLKSFAIIKRIIEQGALKERDVLVLDEPEVNLHPEWQLLYAELIVILQKTLNLTVLLTTHSSTFLKSIDLFSQKHGLNEMCHYYLARESETDKRMTDFEDVTENLEKIYKELVTPTMLLVGLQEELAKLPS